MFCCDCWDNDYETCTLRGTPCYDEIEYYDDEKLYIWTMEHEEYLDQIFINDSQYDDYFNLSDN